MRMPRVARWIGGIGLATGLAACVVHDTPSVNPGYGDGYGTRGQASVSVGEPTPAYVSGMPPEPLYEQMSEAPGGSGSVWIDGYWHWNGFEWVWVQGRWEQEQPGYVYVEPNYDYNGDQYVYTPGYWSQPQRAPRGWNVRDHRDGRPTIVAPPVGSGGYRPPIVGTRHPRPGTVSGPGEHTPHAPGTYHPPRRYGGGTREPGGNPPVYDPRGGMTWRPAPRQPIGVFNGPQPTGATGGGAIGSPSGGAIGGPSGPGRGGTIFGGPPAGSPVQPASPPPSSPPPQQPQPVFVPAPTGGLHQPAPVMGRPIYVNPPPGDVQRPSRPLGGPIYVNPAGPQAPSGPAPGTVFRPTAPSTPPPPPPVHVAPPPPPPAPGPRSNNPRRPQ